MSTGSAADAAAGARKSPASTPESERLSESSLSISYGTLGGDAVLEEGRRSILGGAGRGARTYSGNWRSFPFRPDLLEWESWGTPMMVLAYSVGQLVVNAFPMFYMWWTYNDECNKHGRLHCSLKDKDMNPQSLFISPPDSLGNATTPMPTPGLESLMVGDHWKALEPYVGKENEQAAVIVACEVTRCALFCIPAVFTCSLFVVVMRLALQMRVYYVLLKNGGLLNFQFSFAHRDPIVLAVFLNMIVGMGHYVLRELVMFNNHDVKLSEVHHIEHFVKLGRDRFDLKFVIAPVVVYLYFFWCAHDVESFLIPLSKYYEADPEYARQALGNVEYMQELDARQLVLERDFVGHAEKPQMEAVLRELVYTASIERAAVSDFWDLREAAWSSCQGAEDEKATIGKRRSWDEELVSSMWPARLLLDSRVQDDETTCFGNVFRIIAGTCVVLILFWASMSIKYIYQQIGSAQKGDWENYASAGTTAVVVLYEVYLLGVLRRGLFPRAAG